MCLYLYIYIYYLFVCVWHAFVFLAYYWVLYTLMYFQTGVPSMALPRSQRVVVKEGEEPLPTGPVWGTRNSVVPCFPTFFWCKSGGFKPNNSNGIFFDKPVFFFRKIMNFSTGFLLGNLHFYQWFMMFHWEMVCHAGSLGCWWFAGLFSSNDCSQIMIWWYCMNE